MNDAKRLLIVLAYAAFTLTACYWLFGIWGQAEALSASGSGWEPYAIAWLWLFAFNLGAAILVSVLAVVTYLGQLRPIWFAISIAAYLIGVSLLNWYAWLFCS